ncbi:hypothetical protein [Actinoplanes regularis]|uniref:Uncharacterized protein n=1 Tax=Actinoplanes regularis TaxID=52697 RepID=A0A239A2J3_9ACTN|nr:hypothetical protein [Actinoplanes regularis]GIE87133.1 hypothetical protein Are01nite_36130 [Actinoplanes regularis]SNR89876.1 hypothetical protein SAMN06264365_10728 [Actinoplanes regularis]
MISYPEDRRQRALDTATSHPERSARQRAREKATAWTAAIEEMLTGRVRPGSRTPVADLPAWGGRAAGGGPG